jgi:hypothetical protein
MKTITIDECTKMIRAALKQGFPFTKFSVRKTKSTYSHNIDVSWTDGPTGSQVKPILDRFESKGFDGMTDSEYSCGKRILCGCEVEVQGNYVQGQRTISDRLRLIVVKKLVAEAKLDNLTIGLDQHGNLKGAEQNVPFAWFDHWEDKKYMTVEDFESRAHVLAHDSGRGDWFSNLVYRIENRISLEEQKPINAGLLPEYIDINATVSTGRAEEFEPRQPMFEGHAAFEAERQAVESFESTSVAQPAQSVECNCSIGRSYPSPDLYLTVQ